MYSIESKIDKIIQIGFTENEGSMIGMCSKCYSSGVSLVLDKESFEVVCDKCRNRITSKKNHIT